MPMKRSRIAVAAGAAVLAGGVAAAAGAFAGAPAVPPAKPLATAVHDALAAPAVQGISARITFTNKLVDSSSLSGGGPLLAGASGRLWLAADGRLRLELQSDRGDAQITSDGKQVTVYDASANTAWIATLPARKADTAKDHAIPTVADIQARIADLSDGLDLSGATGANVAGREAYSVRATPKRDGGLVGAGELAWDAATGVPLRFGVYAKGASDPVLELAATGITYGPIDASALTVGVPAGAHVTRMDFSGGDKGAGGDPAAVTGQDAVAKALPFTLSAPATLAGMARQEVRLVHAGDHPAALVTYGQGLGGLAVLEQVADPAAAAPAKGEGGSQLELPKVSIPGATDAQELPTALGTVLRFSRDGVEHTVLGSVDAATARAAARGL